MSDLARERERAEGVQQRYAAATQRIRDNDDLTDEARRRLLAEEWTTARKQLDDLQAAERERLSVRERDLERRLFGLGAFEGASQAISTRDAQDRASRLTRPSDAAELLRRAEHNGDEALARAVAHHAIRQSRTAPTREATSAWDAVAGVFLDARPQLANVVEELAEIERLNTRQVLSVFSLPQPHGRAPRRHQRRADRSV